MKLKDVFLEYSRVLLTCPLLFLYIFSNDINIISLNGLVYRKICLRDFNETICDHVRNSSANVSAYLQESASQQMIYLNMAFLIPAIFSIIHLASLGDRSLNYRTPLIVSVVGSIAQSMVCFFSVDQITHLCFGLLFLSQIVNGVCGGGSLAFISSCFSHISVQNASRADTSHDDSAKKSRSIRFSLCESSLLLGQFLGSFSSGYIIGNKTNLNNFKHAYIISFSIYVLVLVYIVVMFVHLKRKEAVNSMSMFGILDESTANLDVNSSCPSLNSNLVEQSQQVPEKDKKIQLFKKQFSFLSEIWQLLSRRRPNNARFHILSLLVLFFLGSSISLGIISLQYLYLIKKPIYLTQITYGIFRALNTLFRAISLLVVLPVLKNCFNISDSVLYVLGLTSELLNLVVFAISSWYSYLIWLGE